MTNAFVANGNETTSPTHITAILSLLSVMSMYYHVEYFKVISDIRPFPLLNFQKLASMYGIKLKFENFNEKNTLDDNRMKSLLIMKNSPLNYSLIIETNPKLIASVFISNEKALSAPDFVSELTIPSSMIFYIIVLHRDTEKFACSSVPCTPPGKLLRIYKPTNVDSPNVYTLMSYDSDSNGQFRWSWDNHLLEYYNFKKRTRDMRGITVSVGIASVLEKETAVSNFVNGKNSFYWKELEEYLKFTGKIHFEQISRTEKSVSRVYIKLLINGIDGLGVLPVMTSDRNRFLDYIVTGIDSKFQLMVRTPQFVYSWQSILKPLATDSWIFLGCTILLTTITLRITTYSQKKQWIDFPHCFLLVFGYVCNQGSPHIPKNSSSRLVCFTASLFSFYTYQLYTSNFYSMLSTKEAVLPFASLEQLIAKRTYGLYMHPDTAIYPVVMNAKNGTFKRLRDEILSKNPIHQLKTDARTALLEKVCKGKGAILGLPFQVTSMKELKCPLVSVNSGYFPTNVVIVIRNRFPYKPQFQHVLLRLLEGGIAHKFREEKLDPIKKQATKTNVMNEPVSLEHIALVLAFYIVFVAFSLVILGFEFIVSKNLIRILKRGIVRSFKIKAHKKIIL